ncbi:hypothetical protein HDF18_04195 [Mucilaginibacter sp. X5P1]|uniref:hypothetical protein n=1 Tax=Mucilaginibacter sp. X5P1 TaxID=2723088 RepID=UPI00161F9998|nr:hypothetical protein [Mucilaginibacter sp. X5P1]MBB6136817.1 hypothetical protein [Mucilaginibacter sp. X5P1]
MYPKYRIAALFLLFISLFFVKVVHAQSELAPWGNIMGIRQQGQLFDFQTSLNVIAKGGSNTSFTAKEAQRPHYVRDGNKQIVTTNIDSLYFKETITDVAEGEITVNVKVNAQKDTAVDGVYFCISLPDKDYGSGELNLERLANGSLMANGFSISSHHRVFNIAFDKPAAVIMKNDTGKAGNKLFFVALTLQGVHKGDSLQNTFTIKVSGDIDKSPVNIVVNTAMTGQPFDGLGGNFRLQFPKTDPQVIDYCLDNLRVAWGRVEMPWHFWQPQENMSPADSANQAKPVVNAMLMAQRLGKKGIPLILSAWFPPTWAITGKFNFRPVNGVWGNPLNPDKMQEIYKSITDYILYLKTHYGVEIGLFSFNESDLGINVRVTAQEHDELIKGLGAYFAAHGLKTKMLLGDNSDATTYKFIYPALNDPAALPYIGAISFHSWRGWDTGTLQKWADAAKQINIPLIVGEGSIDAQAWGYPQIFKEPTYALEEINLYTRLLNICQPLTILQWQMTTDYSPLIGGGIFGNDEPLHPGQRFWNLKQLASTPAHLFAMPVTCSAGDVSCAALGDNNKGIYTLHLVNNGTTRNVTLTGLPANLKRIHLYVTNQTANMQETPISRPTNGTITFEMNATSYYTLTVSK